MSSRASDSGDSTRAVATEFVIEEFETEVETPDIERFASGIEDIVRTLRSRITSDDRLEALLRSEPGREVLRENDSGLIETRRRSFWTISTASAIPGL